MHDALPPVMHMYIDQDMMTVLCVLSHCCVPGLFLNSLPESPDLDSGRLDCTIAPFSLKTGKVTQHNRLRNV